MHASKKYNTIPILDTLMMEAVSSSETLILTRAIQHNIPEDGILQKYCFPMSMIYCGVIIRPYKNNTHT
jgi:hypothetical protein